MNRFTENRWAATEGPVAARNRAPLDGADRHVEYYTRLSQMLNLETIGFGKKLEGTGKLWQSQPPKQTLTGGAARKSRFATAAGRRFPSAGGAAAGSGSVKRACRKIYGGCRATVSRGSARIAEIRMALEISDHSKYPRPDPGVRCESRLPASGWHTPRRKPRQLWQRPHPARNPR